MSKKLIACFYCLTIVAFGFGCTTTNVHLTLRNIENFPQQVRITTKDQHMIQEQEIQVGEIMPNQTKPIEEFKVKHGGQFQVVSMFPNSGIIFDSTRTVSAKPDPLKVEMDIFSERAQRLDDSKSLQMISDAFKKLGPDSGVYPMKLSEMIKTRFGALLIMPGGEKPDKSLFTLTPAQLGVREVKLEEIEAAYNATKESNSTKISGSASTQAKVSVPVYGTFGFNYDVNSAYEVAWNLEGFGAIPKMEDPDKHYITKLNDLSPEIKKQILKVLTDNKGSRLIYVNNVYAIKKASLTVTEGVKVVAGGNVDVGSVVTVSGVFSFQNQRGMTNEYEAFALNYWGDEINYTVAKTKSLKGSVVQEILFYSSSNKPLALKPYLFGDLKAADLLHK